MALMPARTRVISPRRRGTSGSSALRSIAIGFGTPGNQSKPGGSGIVYFDDIRIYASRCVLSKRSPEFAMFDYAPEATGGDCIVNYEELDVMTRDWLLTDMTVAAEAPNSAALVAHYEFENNADDSSGNGNNGTLMGGATYGLGKVGLAALSLNGTDAYVNCGNDPSVNITGKVTICAWVKLAAGSLDQKVASNQSGSGGGYKMAVFTNDKVEFEVRNSANQTTLNRSVAGGTVLSPGVWRMVPRRRGVFGR